MKRRTLAVLVVAFLHGCSADPPPIGAAVDASPTPRARELPEPARSSKDVKDPVFSVGQEVFITEDGMVPEHLVSIVAEKISFINETSRTRTIVFDAIEFDSGPIAPGEAATYTPDGAYAIAYHVAEDPDIKGQVQVEPYFEPGEDPAAEGRFDADTPGETATPRT